MTKAIVITSIFEPSKAVRAYAEFDGAQLIVVGDKKTPANWTCAGADYISISRQMEIAPQLSKAVPFNHYSRKMLGYLVAVKNGAEIVIDTDDDNVPKPNWSFPDHEGDFDKIDSGGDFINVYQWFTEQKIWPRGLPLDLINKDFKGKVATKSVHCSVGVWQGLADGDPDVDAIYRLTCDEPCEFHYRAPLVLAQGCVCPYNSQNTAFVKALFPLLYLPAHVTFRFTDILRGLVAQPLMWLYGYSLGFTQATVFQDRNPHDYMNDFVSELPMYLHCRDVVDIVSDAVSSKDSLENNLHRAYSALLAKKIVVDDELRTLDAWLSELKK